MKKTVIFFTAALLLLPVATHAATVFGGKNYSLPASITLDGNLYIGATTVTMYGTVTGDAVLAGGTVHIPGSIQGDVAAAGGTLDITGTVGGDVRIMGGTLTLDATVPGDVVIAGGDVQIFEGSVINGDVLVAGGTVDIRGTVKGRITGAGGNIRLAGPVAGDVDLHAGELTLESTAALAGNLTYTARQEAVIESGATIAGTKVFHQAKAGNFGFMAGGVPIVGWFIFFVGSLAVALLLTLIYPGFSGKVMERASKSFWKQVLFGFLFLIGIPFAAILLLVSTVGWLLGSMLLAIYVLFFMFGSGYGAVLLGVFVTKAVRQKKQNPLWLSAVIGSVVMSLICLVPFLGWIVVFIFFLGGLGSFAMVDWEKMRSS